MLIRAAMSLVILLLMFHANAACGLSTDPRLLQLVPPDRAMVAGWVSSPAQGRENSFLLITRDNKRDLMDFSALVGGDATRNLHALVFVEDGVDYTKTGGHSLLVSGHFDREAIFRFRSSGAARKNYRGVAMLLVPAFARERDSFNEVRWLAVLDAEIAIFGSVQSVQRELDRWLDQQPTDTLLLERLNDLNGHDDTWCFLTPVPPGGLADRVLGTLDARFGDLATEGRQMGFGIRFGRKIEILVSADASADRIWSTPHVLPSLEGMPALNLLAPLRESERATRVVKVSRRRYEQWITDLARRCVPDAVERTASNTCLLTVY
jgi:hypothetical protein